MNTNKINTSYQPVVWGFIISVFLTLAAYSIVAEHLFTGWLLIFAVVGLAIVQGVCQLVFFLHLGVESKPRWNLMIFLFMVMIMVIIVVGSMWIMRTLDYNLMPVNQ